MAGWRRNLASYTPVRVLGKKGSKLLADVLSRVAAAGIVLGCLTLAARADDSGFAYMHDIRGRCMTDHFHYGNGSGGTVASAQRAAIGSWSSFTDFEYGSDWARWSRAAGKQVSCSRGGSGYSCEVSARPCK